MTAARSHCARGAVLLALLALVSGCAAATLKAVVRNGVPIEPFALAGPVDLTITRPGVGPMSPVPWHLLEGDEIRTGPATEVLLRFPRAYVLVRPNTHVTVKCLIINGPTEDERSAPEPAPSPGAAENTAGSVAVKARGSFQTHSEIVDAAVPGTRYTFRVDGSRVSHIRVYEGAVDVSSRARAWENVLVHQGEAIDVAGTAPPQKRVMSPQENVTLDAAFEAFDRLLDLSGF